MFFLIVYLHLEFIYLIEMSSLILFITSITIINILHMIPREKLDNTKPCHSADKDPKQESRR